MRGKNITRVTAGALFIVFGVLAFLGALGLFNFGALFAMSWPLLLVIAGLLVVLSEPRNWLWALFLAIAGTALFLNASTTLDFDFWNLFWPVIIVLVGVSIVSRSFDWKGMQRIESTVDRTDKFVLMSGAEEHVISDDYVGGNATALLGGIELDLRGVQIKKQATLDVFALMGGIEVKVPAGIVVKSEVSAFLGGVEVKADSEAKKGAPVLVITGTVALGGVEVKYQPSARR